MDTLHNTTRSVSAIEHGTVIDHICAGEALPIIEHLKLSTGNHTLTVGLGLKSNSLGSKDIIKISGYELTKDRANHLAILCSGATVSIIKDYAVADKFQVTLPKEIKNIIVCPNPKCITNAEEAPTLFYLRGSNGTSTFQCHYCERIIKRKDIKSLR